MATETGWDALQRYGEQHGGNNPLHIIIWLWLEGFKIVPLDGSEDEKKEHLRLVIDNES